MHRVAHFYTSATQCATHGVAQVAQFQNNEIGTKYEAFSQVSAISYPFVIFGKCATAATCATPNHGWGGTSGTTFYVRRYAGAYTQARSRINKPCATCATQGPK